ncbi:MAG: hypothetical protein HETSPECPRED_001878 [Heterodermia speciosa]|uniref:Major royal jelly protein n=1 Tax=Heterodermia speciosa TaxID=116794 RepID=A0A8H3J2Y7_9LECA|nr:MAG: hypothetical protein HETSPECPRED_001878 [Heterodermia speciosa]
MQSATYILASLAAFGDTFAQQLPQDPGVTGPPVDIVHLYNDLYPQGVAVSSSGRKFSSYARALDPNNTAYTVAELIGEDHEVPFPSADFNKPPGGPINYTVSPAVGANDHDHLIGAQSVVVDPLDRLWIIDTGRAITDNFTVVPASPGGAKLIGIDLTTNKTFKTIVFPPNVVYPDSYINDVRFDLRRNVSGTSGQGVAYMTDSSPEGRNGIITIDLGTSESWRHLDNTLQVTSEPGFVPIIWGEAIYNIDTNTGRLLQSSFGSDGIALSADGDTLYWCPIGSRTLYSIPTARLRDRGPTSELMAQQSVVSHGQKGISDGLETDSNNRIYIGDIEGNGINIFHPNNGSLTVYVRDPRIAWPDTFSVTEDGYIYWVNDQYWRTPTFYPQTDRREKPFTLMRVKCPDGGKKVLLK